MFKAILRLCSTESLVCTMARLVSLLRELTEVRNYRECEGIHIVNKPSIALGLLNQAITYYIDY